MFKTAATDNAMLAGCEEFDTFLGALAEARAATDPARRAELMAGVQSRAADLRGRGRFFADQIDSALRATPKRAAAKAAAKPTASPKPKEESRAMISSVQRRQAPPAAPAKPAPAVARVEVMRDEADKTRGLSDFLLNVALAGDPSAPRDRAAAAVDRLRTAYKPERRALSVHDGPRGGWTLPSDLHRETMQVVAGLAIVRPRATVVPMSTLELDVPVLDPTGAHAAGVAGYFGGLGLNWSPDDGTPADAPPRFAQAKLSAKLLRGYFEVSHTLLRFDPEAFGAMAGRLLAGAVAHEEDAAFLSAAGAIKPLGILHAPARLTTAARGNAGAIDAGDLRKAWGAMLPGSKHRAVWAASPTAEGAALAASDPSAAVPVEGQPYGWFGRPVYCADALPALNTAGDLMLADFAYYLIGDPIGESLVVETSPHPSFRAGLVAFRLTHYVAGMPWVSGPIVLRDGSTTASPFVALGTA